MHRARPFAPGYTQNQLLKATDLWHHSDRNRIVIGEHAAKPSTCLYRHRRKRSKDAPVLIACAVAIGFLAYMYLRSHI